jgi:hypothetical protein
VLNADIASCFEEIDNAISIAQVEPGVRYRMDVETGAIAAPGWDLRG